MNRRKLLGAISIVTVLAVGGFFLHLDAAKQKMLDRYGDVPGIFAVIVDETDAAWCEKIDQVRAPAHYNIWGEVWQDPHLKWEDVEIRGRERVLEHGRTGPVERGQVVCGFTQGSWTWVYTPRDEMLFARS